MGSSEIDELLENVRRAKEWVREATEKLSNAHTEYNKAQDLLRVEQKLLTNWLEKQLRINGS